MSCRCFFVAFGMDLRLRSPIKIIFRDCSQVRRYVPNIEAYRTLWRTLVQSGENSGDLEKNPVNLEKKSSFLEKKMAWIL